MENGFLLVSTQEYFFLARTTEIRCRLSGELYSKRAEYLARLEFPLERIAPAVCEDILRSLEMLADAYCSTQIFVNLPSYSRLLVTKVTEVMACRTMIITPQIDNPSGAANLRQFEDGRHLVYYDPSRPKDIGDIVGITPPTGRMPRIAQAGWAEIARGHSLRSRLEKIISDARFLLEQGRIEFSSAWTSSDDTSVPVIGEFYYVLSFHGSFLCTDKDHRRLCHEKPGGFRPKVVLEFNESEAYLYFVDLASLMRRRLGLVGPAGDISERPEFLEKKLIPEKVRDHRFALRIGDNYLSADNDGFVRNDRSCCLDWEHYRLIRAEALPK